MRHPGKTREPCRLSAVPRSLSSPKVLGQELRAGHSAAEPPPLCRPLFYMMACVISGCHTLDGDWEASAGSGGRIPSWALDSNLALLPGPMLPPRPGPSNLPTSSGAGAAHNQKRPRTMSTPSQPCSSGPPSACPWPEHLPVSLREKTWSPSKREAEARRAPSFGTDHIWGAKPAPANSADSRVRLQVLEHGRPWEQLPHPLAAVSDS